MSRFLELTIIDQDSHKTWIFAEDLSLQLEASGLGVYPMSEADAVKDVLRIRDIKARNLKRCVKLVGAVLDRHFMREHVTIKQGRTNERA